jgi:hypothetical protein
MTNISCEALITNYFGENETVNKISLFEISKIKKEIEQSFLNDGTFVFVDTTIESIIDSVESNPKYFKFNEFGTEILFDRTNIEEFYVDLYGIFNSKIDGKIKHKFIKEFEK